MREIKLQNYVEPAPRFATNATLERAEQLRRELEERYLGRSTASSVVPALPTEVH